MSCPIYSPALRGKLPSPEREGQTIKLSVHLSTEPGQLQTKREGNGLLRSIPLLVRP